MELTAEQITKNWESLKEIIEEHFTGNRKTHLLNLYNHFEDRMITCPASGKDYYHGAYPGGYIAHVLNVINFAIKLDKLWVEEGAVRDYDYESLIFTTLNHDLGKIGDEEQEYYVTHNQKWRKDRGEIYVINDNIRYMTVPDRTLWLLQRYGIQYTQSEMIAIQLHDGMYDDGNKAYLVSYTESKQLRDTLPVILHHADMMACRLEKNQWTEQQKENAESSFLVPRKNSKIKSTKLSEITHDFFNTHEKKKD